MDEVENVTEVKVEKAEVCVEGDVLVGLDKEDREDVWKNRTRMAWVALWAIIIPTLYVVVTNDNAGLVEKLGELLSWYYLSLASIVGAFFGFKAWASVKGK